MYKIKFELNEENKQQEIENCAEAVKSTISDNSDFYVFSVRSNKRRTLYLSSFALELCTEAIEKLGLSSTECEEDTSDIVFSLTE